MREEARLQKWCVTWLRERGYLVVGSASGAQFSRAWFTWKWLTGQGVEAGVPDLLILEVGADQRTPGLAVELKTGRRMLTAQQRGWFERARDKGWSCHVVRSKDEFVAVLHDHVGREDARQPTGGNVGLSGNGQGHHDPIDLTAAVIDLTGPGP